MWTKSEGRRGIGGDSLATDETRIEHGTGPRPVLRTVYIRRSVEREGFIKFLTVRNLISGWAATARDFHDSFLEWWTGGIDRRAIKAKALQEATEATESVSGASFVGGTGHRPTGVELRDFLVSEDAAMRQLRRSGLFVANGSQPANRPVGVAPPAPMPLLRSFVFLPFAIYKYAAPQGGWERRPCSLIQRQQATGLCQPVRVPRRSADIPVGGFWGLSSPQFLIADNIAELESSANPQAGKPALLATASPFRSAGRRPARASRPCYPFSNSTHSTTNHYSKSCQISHCEKFERK